MRSALVCTSSTVSSIEPLASTVWRVACWIAVILAVMSSVARAVCEGSLDLPALAHAPVTEIARILGAIKGIGPWTSAYVLARGFGRHELVPEGDVALRAAVAQHYGRAAATDKDVKEVLAPYEEWKGLAAFALIVDYAISRYRILQPTLFV